MVYEQLRVEDALGTFHVSYDHEPIEARAEIVRLRADGYGWSAISRSLNRRGVTTPTGRGVWWPETVRRHVDPAPWRAYVARYRRTHPR